MSFSVENEPCNKDKLKILENFNWHSIIHNMKCVFPENDLKSEIFNFN